jgi:hypothetical protein
VRKDAPTLGPIVTGEPVKATCSTASRKLSNNRPAVAGNESGCIVRGVNGFLIALRSVPDRDFLPELDSELSQVEWDRLAELGNRHVGCGFKLKNQRG